MCIHYFLEDAIGNIRHTCKCRVQRYSFTQTFQFLEKWTMGNIGMSMCFFEDVIGNVRHTGTCSIKKYRLYTNVSNVLKKWTIGDNGMSTCFFFENAIGNVRHTL